MAKKKSSQETNEEPLEKQLWKAADKLRRNIDAAEYKHVVLGLPCCGSGGRTVKATKKTGEYEDIKGFCASVLIERVAELDYVLTPGRYVGLPDEEDDFNFAERFAALKAEFESQLLEEAKLNQAIAENLAKIKIESDSPRPISGRGARGEGQSS